MKKFALVAGGLLVANTAANAALHTIRTTGGTVQALVFLAVPHVLVPAPITYKRMIADAA